MRKANGRRKPPPHWVNCDKFEKSLRGEACENDGYCSSTILPLAYSNRLSFDRNDRPSRVSDNASSGNPLAAAARPPSPPSSTMANLVGAAFTVPFAVVTVAR